MQDKDKEYSYPDYHKVVNSAIKTKAVICLSDCKPRTALEIAQEFKKPYMANEYRKACNELVSKKVLFSHKNPKRESYEYSINPEVLYPQMPDFVLSEFLGLACERNLCGLQGSLVKETFADFSPQLNFTI